MATIAPDLLKSSTAAAQKAASLLGGTFEEGVGYKEPATPKSAYKDIDIGGPDETAGALSSLLKTAERGSNAKINENDIYRSKLKTYQAEIDANNKIYAEQLQKATAQGVSNLGSGRAIQARSGLLGSDFASSQNAEIIDQNDDRENLVRAEKAAKIASILGKARKDATDEVAAKRAAQQKSTTDYLEYLGASETRKASNAKKAALALLDNEVDYDEADPTQLASIAKNYGITPGEIKSAYTAEKTTREATAAKEKAQAIKDNSFSLSEGQSRYSYNPDTGSYDLVAAKPKTYAPKDDGGGSGGAVGVNPGIAVQPGYSKLTASQKKQADSLNNLVRSLKDYYAHVRDNANGAGTDFTGKSAALTSSKLNSIIFAAAQAEGTGALQKADRDVIVRIIPDPSSPTALLAPFRGGKPAQLEAILDQTKKYTQNLATYGLVPTEGAPGAAAPEVVEERRVEVISPDGTEGTILESEVDDYQAQGFQILD